MNKLKIKGNVSIIEYLNGYREEIKSLAGLNLSIKPKNDIFLWKLSKVTRGAPHNLVTNSAVQFPNKI